MGQILHVVVKVSGAQYVVSVPIRRGKRIHQQIRLSFPNAGVIGISGEVNVKNGKFSAVFDRNRYNGKTSVQIKELVLSKSLILKFMLVKVLKTFDVNPNYMNLFIMVHLHMVQDLIFMLNISILMKHKLHDSLVLEHVILQFKQDVVNLHYIVNL